MVPTFLAIQNGIDVALANKESLVVGGHIINKTIKNNNANLFPVDSDHSAITLTGWGYIIWVEPILKSIYCGLGFSIWSKIHQRELKSCLKMKSIG